MTRPALALILAVGLLLTARPSQGASTTTVRLPKGECPPAYDVVVHLHGRDPLVLDGLSAAGIEAAIVVVNRGAHASDYRHAFASSTFLDRLLQTVDQTWTRRGCHAQRRRLVLSAWSAGYGGVLRILQEQPDRVDAFVGMDTPYASYVGRSGHLSPPSLAPFLDFARRAARGEVLMALTHSQIRTPDYASAREVSSAILRALGLDREPSRKTIGVRDTQPVRRAFAGPPPSLHRLTLNTAEGLSIAGFRGDDEVAHVAHLTHAPRTVWARLAAYLAASQRDADDDPTP